MSKTIKKQITCPKCKGTTTNELFSVVTRNDSPNLRDAIMLESIFEYTCPTCGYKAQILSKFLYHDEQNNFMLYLVPNFKESALEDYGADSEFPEFQTIRKRIVTNHNDLKEKVLIFENGYDDLTIEMAKLAVGQIIQKKYGVEVEKAYFVEMNSEKNIITFTFFMQGNKTPIKYETRADIYEAASQITKECAFEEKISNKFLNINKEWATKVLKAYKTGEK